MVMTELTAEQNTEGLRQVFNEEGYIEQRTPLSTKKVAEVIPPLSLRNDPDRVEAAKRAFVGHAYKMAEILQLKKGGTPPRLITFEEDQPISEYYDPQDRVARRVSSLRKGEREQLIDEVYVMAAYQSALAIDFPPKSSALLNLVFESINPDDIDRKKIKDKAFMLRYAVQNEVKSKAVIVADYNEQLNEVYWQNEIAEGQFTPGRIYEIYKNELNSKNVGYFHDAILRLCDIDTSLDTDTVISRIYHTIFKFSENAFHDLDTGAINRIQLRDQLIIVKSLEKSLLQRVPSDQKTEYEEKIRPVKDYLIKLINPNKIDNEKYDEALKVGKLIEGIEDGTIHLREITTVYEACCATNLPNLRAMFDSVLHSRLMRLNAKLLEEGSNLDELIIKSDVSKIEGRQVLIIILDSEIRTLERALKHREISHLVANSRIRMLERIRKKKITEAPEPVQNREQESPGMLRLLNRFRVKKAA
jgi:hypothetical protein